MRRMDRARLLRFINMPHFGQSTEVNSCMKNLLELFHGGFLWLDEPVEVIVGLILEIMRLPKDGPKPSQYFHGKYNYKKMVVTLKKHCYLECDRRAYLIDSINDPAVCIGARIFSSKIVRKNHPVQCNSRVVACVELCAQGIHMNWSLFLMKYLAEDIVVV